MASDDNIASPRWQQTTRRFPPSTSVTIGFKACWLIIMILLEFSHGLTSRPNAENLLVPQHQPLSSLSAKNSYQYVDGCPNGKVEKLLQKSKISWNNAKVEPLECPGFCNKVYNIEEVLDEKMMGGKQQILSDYTLKHHNHKMVAKIFSPLAKKRMDPSVRIGYVDKMASDNGLGPKLLASSDDGILMEYLKGFTLTDIILHGNDSEELCKAIGKLVAEFHGMKNNNLAMPNDCDDETSTRECHERQTNMLWYSIDAMFSIMITNNPKLSLKTRYGDTGKKVEWTIPKLQNEVNRLRMCIENKLYLPCVLGHGDLKPSNIIVQSSNACDVSFLDFELSGLAYRGFDIAKLFRAIEPIPFNQNNYNAFLAAYTDETIRLMGSSPSLSTLRDEMKSCLPLEAQIMLPLTWLEAAIFFLCSSSVDPLNSEKWNEMASKRLESYGKYIGEFECHAEAYYEMMKRKQN